MQVLLSSINVKKHILLLCSLTISNMSGFLKTRQLTTRQCTIWIACLALLFNALLPPGIHAFSNARNSSPLGEICSTGGTKPAAATGSVTQPATDVLLQHLNHCLSCVVNSGVLALPQHLATQLLAIAGHDLFPEFLYHSPLPWFTWPKAHPRAPPALF